MHRQLLFAAWWIGLYLLAATTVSSRSSLSQEALSMFQDPLGWQYAGASERKDVKEVVHAWFDHEGQPQPHICHGNLTLAVDRHFIQTLIIGERRIERRGIYELAGDQLSLVDATGNRDGACTVDVRPKIYYMALRRWEKGVKIGAEFELEREFQRRMKDRKK
jgi:hypothetical protein